MTPREPDRFDVIADRIVARGLDAGELADDIAAALRQAADEALERAAQVAKQSQEDCFCKDRSDELLGGMPCAACMEAARIEGTLRGLAYRALASPAAAPAAETDAPNGPVCGCGRPSRYESGWCGETSCFANVTPPSEPVEPAPLLPRVLAALDIPSVLGNRERLALAAELRAYIAEEEGKK